MLFRRHQQTVRLDAELQFHLDQQVKENIARGLSPEEAHYAALRTFGNPALLRDQARSSWSWNWLEKLLRDLRYGARTLTRSPGFRPHRDPCHGARHRRHYFTVYHRARGAAQTATVPRSR